MVTQSPLMFKEDHKEGLGGLNGIFPFKSRCYGQIITTFSQEDKRLGFHVHSRTKWCLKMVTIEVNRIITTFSQEFNPRSWRHGPDKQGY